MTTTTTSNAFVGAGAPAGKNTRVSRQTLLALLAALLLVPACIEDVPNLNGLDIDRLQDAPTPQLITEAAVGLLIGHRNGKGAANGYVSILGVLGRESYQLDAADPRFRSELLEGDLNAGSPAFGGNFWNLPYRNIQNAYTLLHAVDKVVGLSDGEKNLTRGFAKTIMALEFLTIVVTRDTNAGPIEVDRTPTDPLAPIVTKDQMFDEIERLLNDGCKDLGGCGGATISDSFPFGLGAGFDGFDEPDTFAQFNRAIAARVFAYREKWDDVATALDQSFIVQDAAQLDKGVYHVFGTGSGDTTNGLSSVNIYVHPSVVTKARNKANGMPDNRATRKTVIFSAVGEMKGGSASAGNNNTYSSDFRFTDNFKKPTAKIAIIRNEELLLLRAEALIGLGQFDQALPFLNFVRQNSGGLDPIAVGGLDASNAVDELLYDRRYSLLFEGGHRWIDMRRYGKLNDLLMDDQFTGLKVNPAFPIPIDEANARE